MPPPQPFLLQALHDGDLARVQALVAAGADLQRDCDDTLLRVAHGRNLPHHAELLPLLRLLVEQGVALDVVGVAGASGLCELWRVGRFDAVKLLLEAGAPEALLEWTPLIKAAALGPTVALEASLRNGGDIEARDVWSRTAWLVAVQSGDVDRAALLRAHGADTSARARDGRGALQHAVQGRCEAMLRWLLSLGMSVDAADDCGVTALIEAADDDYAAGVSLLLAAGARADAQCQWGTALGSASSRGVMVALLAAGADPCDLSQEGRRGLLGFSLDPDVHALQAVSAQEFLRSRGRRFGTRNAEPMDEPFWLAMVRAGVSGYTATTHFAGPSSFDSGPVWCAQRFGQSITWLPDGRVVQIGGEHEDGYDPDFCIYNDVFIHEPGGRICILGYPSKIFPPTDFHTATLMDGAIIVIGSLGYPDQRRPDVTPVYRLDLHTWHMSALSINGPGPGWIHRHAAVRCSGPCIQVTGGEVMTRAGTVVPNSAVYVLDLQRAAWR